MAEYTTKRNYDGTIKVFKDGQHWETVYSEDDAARVIAELKTAEGSYDLSWLMPFIFIATAIAAGYLLVMWILS